MNYGKSEDGTYAPFANDFKFLRIDKESRLLRDCVQFWPRRCYVLQSFFVSDASGFLILRKIMSLSIQQINLSLNTSTVVYNDQNLHLILIAFNYKNPNSE